MEDMLLTGTVLYWRAESIYGGYNPMSDAVFTKAGYLSIHSCNCMT